ALLFPLFLSWYFHTPLPRSFYTLFQILPHFLRLHGEFFQMADNPRINLALKHRQDIMTDAVSRIRVFLIGRIRTPSDPLFCQKNFNLLSVETEKRTDPFSLNRTDPAQSFQAGPPCNIEKDSLCIIISVVGGCDLCAAVFP